jgi:hypothetical protein
MLLSTQVYHLFFILPSVTRVFVLFMQDIDGDGKLAYDELDLCLLG